MFFPKTGILEDEQGWDETTLIQCLFLILAA